MSDLTNLPADIVPDKFFELMAEALANEPAPADASPEKAAITLLGDEGGTWSMGFADGAIAFSKEDVDGPPVRVSLTVDSWRAFVAGRVRDAVSDNVDANLLDPKRLSKLYKSADKVEQIKGLKGDLKLTIEDPDQSTEYALLLTTGGDPANMDAPTTSVTLTMSDFLDLVTGKENPQMAFFSGKIRLDGDMNHVMQLYGIMAG